MLVTLTNEVYADITVCCASLVKNADELVVGMVNRVLPIMALLASAKDNVSLIWKKVPNE